MFIHRRQLLDAMTASAIWVMSCSVVNGVKRFWKIAEVRRRLWDSINLNRIWFSHQLQSWIFNHIQINALETLESLSSSTLTSEKACLLRGFHCWIWRGLLCTENRCPAMPRLPLLWIRSNVMGPSTHIPWRFGLIPTDSDRVHEMIWNAWGANLRNSNRESQRDRTYWQRQTLIHIYRYLSLKSLNSLTTSDRAQMRSMCKASAMRRTESLRQVTTSLVGDVGDIVRICNVSCFPLLPVLPARRSRSSDRKWSSGLGITETFRDRKSVV